MDKSSLPDIDTRMGCHIFLEKHHQITGAGSLRRHGLAPITQRSHRSWRRNCCTTLVHMADQATAIKTRLWRIAAKAVGGTDQADGVKRDIVGLLERQAGVR